MKRHAPRIVGTGVRIVMEQIARIAMFDKKPGPPAERPKIGIPWDEKTTPSVPWDEAKKIPTPPLPGLPSVKRGRRGSQ